jgi:hypothetical protein
VRLDTAIVASPGVDDLPFSTMVAIRHLECLVFRFITHHMNYPANLLLRLILCHEKARG